MRIAEEYLPLIGVILLVLLLVSLHLLRRTRLLSISPHIRDDGGVLTARTSMKGLLLSLTLLYRSVIVDRSAGTVTIHRRLFWFFRRTRTIPFRDIEQILYTYEDLNLGTTLGLSGDSKDSFAVGLRLKSGKDVHLFHFLGEGEFQYGWDVFAWMRGFWLAERLFDVTGTHSEDSRVFVDRLQQLTGCPVGRP